MRAIHPRPFQNPGIALLALLAMAVGIGSFSASVVLARALLTDLPVDEAERVVEVARTLTRSPDRHLPLARSTLEEVRRGVTGLRAVGGFRLFSAHLTADDVAPVRVRAAEATPGVFRALGVEPLLGRWLPADGDDEAGTRAAVLGHRIWRERFGGDRAVLGRRIRVNDRLATVVGVMPPDFAFPRREELWVSLPEPPEPGAGSELVNAVGRLAEGASVESLRAELAGVATEGSGAAGTEGGEARLTVRSWEEMLRDEDATADAVPAVVVLLALVLAVACANVALLFLVRALRAERTTATRMALGAPRSTLVLERLLETLALAALGGTLGLGLTVAWTEAMQRVSLHRFDYGVTFSVDWAVALATAFGVVAAALAAGLLPALRGTDLDLASSLREGSRGSSVRLGGMAKAMLVVEVAFSCAVLVSIGHSLRGMTSTLRSALTELPVPSEELLVARYEPLDARHPDRVARTELSRRVVETLARHPGVEGVAVADALPGVVPGFGARSRRFEVERSERLADELPRTRVLAASPELFSLLGAGPVRGRSTTWEDRDDREPVVVVNESFAARYLAGGDLLGARIALAGGEWRTVVGLVPDVAMERPDGSAHAVYVPVSEIRGPPWILVHAAGDPLSLIPALRDAVWSEDPRVPLYDIGTFEGIVLRNGAPALLLVGTMTGFALAALLLTLVGLHGLMAFTMGRRRREIAIRSALGAPRTSVAWQLLGEVGGRVAVGLVAGVMLAWWLSPHLGEGLLGADPRDPLFYLVVPAILAGATLLAALAPLSRALRTEVMEALRIE